jgi:FkbM family methyltransferase
MPKWNEQEYVYGLISAFDVAIPLPRLLVEFGALGGVCITKPFLEKHGNWKGIWIEPSPLGKEMVRVAQGMKNVETHRCAVADYDGEMEFYFHTKRHGASSHIPQHERKGKLAFNDPNPVQQMTVTCRRLSSILGDRQVGFMIVDVEEYELPILRDMIATDVLPVLLMVEFTGDEQRAEEKKVLQPHYRLLRRYMGPNNDVYLRSDVSKSMKQQRDQCRIRF